MNDLEILQKTETLHEAHWWESEADGRVHCFLCPRHCHIGPGQSGFCFIRVNQAGKLYSLGYGAPAALQVDPIEKKPLNYFLPGDTLRWLKNETRVWFEITNLMISTLNDDPVETQKLAEWILANLGPDVPLHFTAFHPDFKLQDKPKTPPETLHRARQIAREAGLHYVYEGNIFSEAANTYCPRCNAVLIRRSWHDVQKNRLKAEKCPDCSTRIPGVWS